MKKLLPILLFLFLFVTPAQAQLGFTGEFFGQDACIWWETEDGMVVNPYCGKMIVSDGSLTDNADGTFTLSTGSGGGGSSGSCWQTDGSSNLMPVSGSCVDTLWEEDGSGNLMPQT